MKFDFCVAFDGFNLRAVDLEGSDDVDATVSSIQEAVKRYPANDIFVLANICSDVFAYNLVHRLLDDQCCEVFYNYNNQCIVLCSEAANELKNKGLFDFCPLDTDAMVDAMFRALEPSRKWTYDSQIIQEEEGK